MVSAFSLAQIFPVFPKAPGGCLSSNSLTLQNPSDPDAGCYGHKGQGYQVQVMETCSPDKSQPDLITHIQVEAAHKSDAQTLLPAIKETRKRDMAPSDLLADSLYGSDDNVKQAKKQGVKFIAPVMGIESAPSVWPAFPLPRTTKS